MAKLPNGAQLPPASLLLLLLAAAARAAPQAPYSPQQQQQQPHFRSPGDNARQLQASALLWRQQGRLEASSQPELERLRRADLFQCDEPSRQLYEQFARQYNRTFADASDKLERLNLFGVTLQRAILFNRVVQNEVLTSANYRAKPEIRNYHFVEATSGARNAALWLADVTDCELGLIKKTLFDLFYHLDANDYAAAWRLVQLNRDFLPGLQSAEGFEQLANILLVRLFDRFRGDAQMNQLFAWPLYLKKLAAYAYNQRLASQPGAQTKLALVSFAYPAFFKDLKYNLPAVNRTGDNVRANQEHEQFFKRLGRQMGSLQERNKRLAIFRQRWSLVNQLNGVDTSELAGGGAGEVGSELEQRRRQLAQLPDWLRVQYDWSAWDAADGNASASVSGKLLEQESDADGGAFSSQVANSRDTRHFRLTQFADLTDAEFVAFLSNDFSLLPPGDSSAAYIERNFPLRPLDAHFRWELAHELQLRRGLALAASELQRDKLLAGSTQSGDAGGQQRLASLKLARQVVDELISDVGLPIGPASLEDIQEEEHFRLFDKLARAYRKPYMLAGGEQGERFSASDLVDERQKRYQIFKLNHGRFRAWMIKEAWQLDEAQLAAMLRLADLTWLELKLTLFRVCCLSADNLALLSAQNATLQYLSSNYELLCKNSATTPDDQARLALNAANFRPQEPTGGGEAASERANDLELYYYYSVHFNKHHLNQAEFGRRFSTFKRNIAALRHHSCVRSLTLYEALRSRQPELLSSIDVLDARRSHLDDLNLDRFDYFALPTSGWGGPDAPAGAAGPPNDLVTTAQLANGANFRPGGGGGGEELAGSRAAISYRRGQFASLLQDSASGRLSNAAGNGPTPSGALYADRLIGALQDGELAARHYRANRMDLVYELVLARYKFCMKNYESIDLDDTELRQQCQPTGPLSEGALKPLGASLYQFSSLTGSGETEDAPSGRLQLAGASGAANGARRDRCAFYRQGLEPWAAGLVRQDERSVELIRRASCAAAAS